MKFRVEIFLLKNLGKTWEAVWRGWGVISAHVEKLFRPVR